ncbi:MAG: hypothetical protein KGI57_05370 [Hyphomicrobiales bacterium]|nr:hypothetical protein [Hyphomicrobiales bacterium]MDE2017117.1 hypothetical protein [Hyphomicrobiales bacterium]
MLDLFDPAKMMIVGVLALLVIPPKDLPGVMRTLGVWVGKMRRMASEFQGQVMEAVRETGIEDVKKDLEELERASKVDVAFDPVADVKGELEGALGARDATPAQGSLEFEDEAHRPSPAPASKPRLRSRAAIAAPAPSDAPEGA